MTELSDFEQILAAAIQQHAGPPRPVDAGAVAHRALTTAPLHHRPTIGMGETLSHGARMPWRLMGVAALLAIGLGAAVYFGVGLPRPTPPAELDATGLIAFSRGGDILVAELSSGSVRTVVAGPHDDTSPAFSPDGADIAFMRGDPWSDEASIVVMDADGSNPRVVVPPGFSDRGLAFAWTPDSAALVLQYDSPPLVTPFYDGHLGIVDASGREAPRALTPPLPNVPGAPYFDTNHQVAPLVRPDTGQILTGWFGSLKMFDPATGVTTELHAPALTDYEPYSVSNPVWSPDASRIVFNLGRASGEMGTYVTYSSRGTFVMDAQGTDIRKIAADDVIGNWSPDGSRIAFQRCSPDRDRPGGVIVIFDLASGDERALESTRVETKQEGVPVLGGVDSGPDRFCGWYTTSSGRSWDYEGWSWSPDGRSIMVVENAGSAPIVVDVETDTATTLSWRTDSAGSWQRAGN